MIGIIRSLLTAESHGNPHTWSATAAAHCWLGLGIWGGLAVILDRWTAVWLAPMLYFVLIECVQLAIAPHVRRSLVWDSGLDTVAFTLGCVAAAYLGSGDLHGAMFAWGASIIVIVVGWITRDRRVP